MRSLVLTITPFVAALFAGCSSGEGIIVRSTSPLTEANGVSLNGVSLNGISLNGVSLNGVSLNGVSLNGVSLNGVSLNGVSLNGTQLNGVSLNGVSLNGTALVGAVLNGVLSNGQTISIRINAVALGANGIWYYDYQFQDDDGWHALCQPPADNSSTPAAAAAINLAGRWNYEQGVPGGGSWINDSDSFTIACPGKALAKCVEMGYQPWASSRKGVQLRDHHQACTRLLRADYCGDGTPYTVDGTIINLYDRIDIQNDTEKWSTEAAWTADGAACISDLYGRLRVLYPGEYPACVQALLTSSCGFSRTTLLSAQQPTDLLMSEFQNTSVDAEGG